MKHEIKKQKTAADNTGDKSSTTPREIEKEKDICSEFNHNRTQKCFEIGIRRDWRRMGSEKRVLKMNNLIRPANRKTRMLIEKPRSKHYWKHTAYDDKKIAQEYQVYQK